MKFARFTAITIGAFLLALAPIAGAAQDLAYDINVQTAPSGFKYVTGGVGDAEQAIMSSRFSDFSFKLVNVKSGPEAAYVSEVHVVIMKDQGNEKVLETTTDGPWLIANLPPGDYTVKAMFEGVTKTKHITLHEGANQRMVIDWYTNAETKELTGPG